MQEQNKKQRELEQWLINHDQNIKYKYNEIKDKKS